MGKIWLKVANGIVLGLLGFTVGTAAVNIYKEDPFVEELLSKTPLKGLAVKDTNQIACMMPSEKKEGSEGDYIYFVSCGGFF